MTTKVNQSIKPAQRDYNLGLTILLADGAVKGNYTHGTLPEGLNGIQ